MNDDRFEYTYSAPTESQRREIESIKKQYDVTAPEIGGDLEELRRLNERVVKPPAVIGVLLGIIGVLILGLGMAMIMEWDIMAWGIVVGMIGIALAALAYPAYKLILKHNKNKYGKQIVALSNKLLHTEEQSGFTE